MDTATGVIIVVIVFALVVGGLLIRYLQSRRVDMGIRANKIVSQEGSVVADDGTGRGVDVTGVNAKADVRLDSRSPWRLKSPFPRIISGASPHIDAEHLNAGRDINLSQHYYNSQDNSASQRSIQDDISALLTKLHSNTVPLSQCIAEAFSLAVKLGNRPLGEFCQRELEGWKGTPNQAIELGDEYPEYRALTTYISNKSINTSFYGWQGSADNAIAYMGGNERDFIKAPLFEPEPIAAIEAKLRTASPQHGLMVGRGKASEFIPKASVPDVILYQYVSIREYEKLLLSVRQELTTRLLQIVR